MKRAMYIKRVKIGAGDALLYRLSEPLKTKDVETNNVVVSAITDPNNRKRTAVFASDHDGKIVSFKSLAESIGTLDHETPLVEAGYEIM